MTDRCLPHVAAFLGALNRSDCACTRGSATLREASRRGNVRHRQNSRWTYSRRVQSFGRMIGATKQPSFRSRGVHPLWTQPLLSFVCDRLRSGCAQRPYARITPHRAALPFLPGFIESVWQRPRAVLRSLPTFQKERDSLASTRTEGASGPHCHSESNRAHSRSMRRAERRSSGRGR